MGAQESLAAALPAWWPEAMLWLGLACGAALVAAAVGVWALVRRAERVSAQLAALDTLRELEQKLGRWLSERDDLDLRRIEHLLIDLRDGSKRVEDLFLRSQEERAASASSSALVPAAPLNLGERVVNRLHTLGYERIEFVTPHQELESLALHDGEIVVEARREGVLCKGRVRIRGGRIDSVQLQPAYSVFP
jgi:hypothetical protein